jgi:hypothetical protein
MWQYDAAAQVGALQSYANDSTTSYLISFNGAPFPSTITPTVGYTVGNADSFGIFLCADSGVFVAIQHDGTAGTFIIDTAFAGPCYWHEVAVRITPGQHNYSLTIPPVFPSGPLRQTVFGKPLHFGAAYEWNTAPPAGVAEDIPVYSHIVTWYDELGREVDSNSTMARFKR